MDFPKKTLWTTAALWVVWATSNHYFPEQFWNIVSSVWTWIENVLWNAWEIINSWSEFVLEPIVWSAAPFAAPMIAWAYGMNKIADLLNIESKGLRTAMTIWWWIAWTLAATTAASPYLVWWAAALLITKPLINTGIKYSKKALWSIYWATIWAPVWAVKWSVRWVLDWWKAWWNTPSWKPKV